ncbi:hypothetical protein THAOC_01921 [Thalassiosira oceanica]|uniref:Uncharacterized protein n=1 Tax=Thalassiosira oceanica TaxID=159749 RepID=K0TC79_THAOC|nr:hypothetical protein THAOC_01921 [Thalassiosira oceanica]|eukprot:EJK76323.1 hypothetical protein THAOC_01921 [Thalassiosira oceanica]
MATVTNLVPIRVDGWNSDGSVRVVDSLVLDTTCLPVSCEPTSGYNDPPSSSRPQAPANNDVNPGSSLMSLVDSNARHLTESILGDAEVQCAVRNSKSHVGRIDLLADSTLYKDIYKQIRSQLGVALCLDKGQLIPPGSSSLNRPSHAPVQRNPEEAASSEAAAQAAPQRSNITRINIRLRQENIIILDEFDYDVGLSGLDGFDPVSIANSMVKDLNLPPEIGPSLVTSIVDQIYGVNVDEQLDKFTSTTSVRHHPTALELDVNAYGSPENFTQLILGQKEQRSGSSK